MARKISKISIIKKHNLLSTDINILLPQQMDNIANKLNSLTTNGTATSTHTEDFYKKKIPLEIEKICNKLSNLNDKIVSQFTNKIVSKNIKKLQLNDLFEMKKLIDREISLKQNNNIVDSFFE
ncbi:hypothetical protein CDIK_0985 [Cucumispora dikerogammari]|nr:hypothetical protein CDIK_0985 [Cucumispora dikerogammari]